MKRSILMLLVIGVAIIFFGCEKMDPLVPESNSDQETSALKAAKVRTFTGICTPVEITDEINKWHDEADEWRVTGTTIWVTDYDDGHKLGGTATLTVDGLVQGETRGTWEMTWHGIMTTNPNGKLKIVAHSVGTGIDGEVEGLTAKWKYSLDLDDGFFYLVKGKITE